LASRPPDERVLLERRCGVSRIEKEPWVMLISWTPPAVVDLTSRAR
jgi:hypothetical protein